MGGAVTSMGGAVTSSGGATTSSGGSTSGPGVSWTVEEGAFASAGSWQGYVWNAADSGSTITPDTFEDTVAGDELCVSGTVGEDPDYGGNAMIGWNINQESGDTAKSSVSLTSADSITVTYTNTGGSPLRIQIQTEDGESDAEARWCHDLPTGTGTKTATFTLGEFNTACWDGSGTDFTSAAIEAAIVAVPGKNNADVAFDFCVQGISD